MRVRHFMIFWLIVIICGVITAQESPERAILYIANQDGESKLYTIHPDENKPELFFDLTAYGRLKLASLSPDGTKLAFVAFEETELLDSLYVMDLGTDEITLVRTTGSDIASLNWSSDSIMLTYLADGINGDFGYIYRYDILENEEQKLDWWGSLHATVSFDIIRSMEQSPDGQKFVFSVHTLPPEGNRYFIVINADGTNAQQLPLNRKSYSPFAWNDESVTIYFVCDGVDDPQVSEICSMDLATQQTETILSAQQLEKIRPGLSERGIYSLDLDQNELLIQFSPVTVIYDIEHDTYDRLLAGLPYEIEVIGWIELPDENLPK